MSPSLDMKGKLGYRSTMVASFTGSFSQAIVNNLAPLLFLTFQREFNVSLSMLGALVTVNFGVQLVVDLLASKLVDRFGYRFFIVAAHFFVAAGLVAMGVLPKIMPPFAGLVVAVALYATGGGLIEVLVSPIVESCPSENKKGRMALVHSFYCWGQVSVVLLSTVFFVTAGVENWSILSAIWALIPFANGILFLFVPIGKLVEDGKGMRLRELFQTKVFWVFVVLMLTAGAAELTISQWSSAFAESGLKVSKTVGDLFGPCLFALLMGIARILYSIFSEKINLKAALVGSGILCVAAYAMTAFSPSPVLALVGCGVAGFSVGIMWPGVISLASSKCPKGGTALFALLALSGDVGCSVGPTAVGAIADATGGSIATGLAYGIVFPVIFIAAIFFLRQKRNRDSIQTLEASSELSSKDAPSDIPSNE